MSLPRILHRSVVIQSVSMWFFLTFSTDCFHSDVLAYSFPISLDVYMQSLLIFHTMFRSNINLVWHFTYFHVTKRSSCVRLHRGRVQVWKLSGKNWDSDTFSNYISIYSKPSITGNFFSHLLKSNDCQSYGNKILHIYRSWPATHATVSILYHCHFSIILNLGQTQQS